MLEKISSDNNLNKPQEGSASSSSGPAYEMDPTNIGNEEVGEHSSRVLQWTVHHND